jgi:hypothetical protein
MHQVSKILFCHESTRFEHLLCPSSGVISCTRGSWYVSCRLRGRCLGESVWKVYQPDSPRQRPHNLHETYQFPRVQLITPDDRHRRCPQHVEFRDKIKFWVLDVSCWLFIRRSKSTFYGQYILPENLAVYDVIMEETAEPDRPQVV